MNAAAFPPRWGPLTPQNWPQDVHRVPLAGGLQMPKISQRNALKSRRESFTYFGSFTLVPPTTAGQVFSLYMPTEPDGDFWCDQIYMTGWFSSIAINSRPPPSTLQLRDARTRRAMTWPDGQGVNTNFFTTILFFSEDAGFDPGSYPFPNGFRSTSTLPQAYCFTRAGGIEATLTMLPATTPPDTLTIDLALSGWKEYEAASV